MPLRSWSTTPWTWCRDLLSYDVRSPSRFLTATEKLRSESSGAKRSGERAVFVSCSKKNFHLAHHKIEIDPGFETMSSSENVKVVLRCRPLAASESTPVLTVAPNANEVVCALEKTQKTIRASSEEAAANKNNVVRYSYDLVYGESAKNEEIFLQSVLPIVESVLLGFNGTIFAYGQTGSGKTHTMMGSQVPGVNGGANAAPDPGMIPRAFATIFRKKICERAAPSPVRRRTVRVSDGILWGILLNK